MFQILLYGIHRLVNVVHSILKDIFFLSLMKLSYNIPQLSIPILLSLLVGIEELDSAQLILGNLEEILSSTPTNFQE